MIVFYILGALFLLGQLFTWGFLFYDTVIEDSGTIESKKMFLLLMLPGGYAVGLLAYTIREFERKWRRLK